MPAQLLTVSDIGSLVAPLSSPAFTDTPTAPTAATATSTTQLATTAFVQQELLAGGSTARALVVSVRNQSGATMTAGTVVYINGSTGNLPTIANAVATSDATSSQTLGMVQTSIANNGTGLVVVRGILGNLNTSGLTEGQQLYLSPTTAGAYTATKQYAPNHLVYIGIVTRAHPTQGSIEVAVQNGFEMDELHNVSAQSPADGDTLRWNAATSLWEKSALGTLATQSGTFSGTSSGTNTGNQTIGLTGDVTGSGTGSFAATIAANAVTNAKAAQVATQTIKGRNTAATGNVEDLSVATVKTMLTISNVDNTSDANKPVSTAQQTALNLKANLASPALTGTPTAPTAVALTNSLQLANTAYADAADFAATAALIEREGLRFDGTAGAAIGNGGIPAVGTGDFTIIAQVNTDGSSAANNQYGRFIGASASFGINSDALLMRSDTSIRFMDVVSGAGTFTGGVPLIAAGVRNAGVTRLYINSVLIGSGTNSETVPTMTFFGVDFTGNNRFSGQIAKVLCLNYALTQAEIAALTRRGLVTLPEQRGGSMVALNTSAFTNSTLDVFSGASATGFTGGSTGAGNKFARSSAITTRKGQRFLATFTYTFTSGAYPQAQFYDFTGLVGDTTNPTVVAGANTVVFTAPSNGTNTSAIITWGAVGAGLGVVSDFSIIPLGTLFEQDSGQRHAGYTVGDTSGNKLDLILPASGVSIIDPAQRGTIRFTTTTIGNQQIGGAQVIIPTNARITSWVINSSGTPNVTLGNVSAGAQYRASAAVVSGNNEITLLTRFTTTGNLWVNSSTTATLKHTIQWEYIQ